MEYHPARLQHGRIARESLIMSLNLLSPPIISVAPMMDYTDRHDRYFLRLIAPDVVLYTEMITTHALIHGDPDYLLKYHSLEHPIVLQLGGSEPGALAQCAKMGESFGYDEINLNVGCPSSRVSSGRFGACLMLEPELVADCVAEMKSSVRIPVTVKCRIGVDHQDSYENLYSFIESISMAGCRHFIIHARKAWLKGLSPKQNREIPPLCYEVVKNIKRDFPHLTITINGGIKTIDDVKSHLSFVDGVMIGREACSNPYILSTITRDFFPNRDILSRFEVIDAILPYIESELKNGTRLSAIARHLLGLFHGVRGANQWRRYLSENMHHPQAGIDVIKTALRFVHH